MVEDEEEKEEREEARTEKEAEKETIILSNTALRTTQSISLDRNVPI